MSSRRKRIALAVVIVAAALLGGRFGAQVTEIADRKLSDAPTERAPRERHGLRYQRRDDGQMITGSGIVVRTLADDNEGSRHQRFVLRVPSGQTLLVAHNVDLAPRVEPLERGDTIEFSGQFEWNDQGGVLHWTHDDPDGSRPGGWLKRQGKTYR